MGIYKMAVSAITTCLVVLGMTGFSLSVAADSEKQPVTTQAAPSLSSPATEHVVTFIRDRNYACTQCHKDSKDALLGAHASAIHSQTNRNIGCVDCHSTIGENHRDGAEQVTKFAPSQTVAGTVKPAADPLWIKKQNETCTNCHDNPDELRQANWTHDVHALDLSCASCHNVHPSTDPMKGITKSSKIKMCVDCHSDQRKAKGDKK
ncbi:cytochrome c nitrite reductase pentaheme subunit [Photobacterium jeanii]|uniref:Cytochrome c nitrite reductase pentaheme subunit n=1 Tax=Photobacterium jeanii TaxID=858640 RepID=A0A178K9I3_9GAMM|nr:cytochrome c nitrite reductase pentaheme subunit [Photobacterium jeanii]OAN13726.1 cytochrome c nitrite reductase pentaheme subunit [Photobacterium jeanii]PST88847.1 cytochrome c nitrite reductase pentaheme subunit [Photobacterium jeanii]